MSTLTVFLHERINQLQARKKTIQECAGKNDVYKGKGFTPEDLPKIEADIKETEQALWGIGGELIPDRIAHFISWTHSDEGSRWYWDKSHNAWTQDGYRNRTTNEHFREYLKQMDRESRISSKTGSPTLK